MASIPKDCYGQALARWFSITKRLENPHAEKIQKLTELAHEKTEGRPGQVDWRENENYYVRWMRWIFEELGVSPPVTDHEVAGAWHFMCQEVGRLYTPRSCPSVFGTLEELKKRGYRLGVLSNNNGYVSDALAFSGIRHLFEVVIDSAREGRVKPDAELFHLAARRAGCAIEKILYVGDSYECDILGASLSGMSAIWLGGDDRPLPARAARVRAFSELLDHLP